MISPHAERMVAWARGLDDRRGALEAARDGGDVAQLRAALRLPGTVTAVEVRQAAAEALQALSAQLGDDVSRHQRANLEARGATKAPGFEGTPAGGGVLGFLLRRTGAAGRAGASGASGASPRLEGPEPRLDPPSAAAVARARHRLSVLPAGQRLAASDARALVEQAVFAARHSIAAIPGKGAEAFSAPKLAGLCGYSQACTAYALSELGVAPEALHLHQAFRAFPSATTYNHAFLVAELPDGKRYLLDATFRQFFNSAATGPNEIGHPGTVMRQTARGSAIADTLLAQGYVELTDEVAREYGRALSCGAHTTATAASLLGQTMKVDYDRQQLSHLPPPPGDPS